ncbi:hypothetical protein [Isoptericola chiayiensis]|uniref:hypothetical protein n=1 Tax=Isoptericola chiayiensis TaxID=579446 RepID=UPI001556D72A|nr:hypothetical protein [Isoptericola chiayiensis]NOW00093.1 hypothetical protein [Isoptericola chiayiensis]
MGLIELPTGHAALILAWSGGLPMGLLVMAGVLVGLVIASALTIRRAGGTSFLGPFAVLVGTVPPLVLLSHGGLEGGRWALSMAISSLLATTVAALAFPATRRPAALGSAVLLGIPAVVAGVAAVVGVLDDYAERAAVLARPYKLSGDYTESYLSTGPDGSSIAVYELADGGEIHVASTASIDDDLPTSDLSTGPCHTKTSDITQNRWVECDVVDAPWLVLSAHDGATSEDLVACAEHLEPMSKFSFYRSFARGYIEVIPG